MIREIRNLSRRRVLASGVALAGTLALPRLAHAQAAIPTLTTLHTG